MSSVTICGSYAVSEPAKVNYGAYVPNERLCIFCAHFQWQAEEMWGMGSTQTGPMFSGGDSTCRKGRYEDADLPLYPKDEDDFRAIIMTAITCPDYLPPSGGG